MRSIHLLAVACALCVACASQQYAAADPPPNRPAGPPTANPRTPGRPAASSSPPAVVASSPVAGRDFPDVPERTRPAVLCGDGADMIVAAGDEKVFRILRSHQITQSRGPKAPLSCQVRGAGPSAVIAVSGVGGEYARYNGSDWEFGLAPALDGEDLPAVISLSATRTAFAGRQRALYTREGDTWTLQRYPSGGIDVVYAGVDTSGTTYLVGAHGRLLAFAAGAFRDLNVTGIPAEVLSSPWTSGWYSARSNSLWIFAKKWIVRVELSSLQATVQKIPLFFDADHGMGMSTPRGDLFALSSFGDGALFDGATFYKLEGRDHRGAGLYLDPVRSVLYASGWDRLVRIPVKHPHLGTGQGEAIKDR